MKKSTDTTHLHTYLLVNSTYTHAHIHMHACAHAQTEIRYVQQSHSRARILSVTWPLVYGIHEKRKPHTFRNISKYSSICIHAHAYRNTHMSQTYTWNYRHASNSKPK